MARPEVAPGLPRLVTFAAVAVVTAALYLGKEVLMPLALGVLLSFLLAPLVTRVERAGLGRIPAVIVVAVFSFALIGSASYFVFKQLVDLAADLPAYRSNIHQRIETIRGHHGAISEAAKTIEVLKLEISPTQPASAPASAAPESDLSADNTPAAENPAAPVPVTVVPQATSPLMSMGNTLTWLAGPLGTAAIVIIFVVFMLIQREDLRDRIIFLLGRGHIHLTTQALDDASTRISRYLLMQLIINVSYGVPVAIALYFLGLPNALVWGLLAALLRYLPYIGPWVAASLPILLSLAVFPDWWHPIAVILLFILLELLSNNVMEPWLYGSSTGLSSVAVIVSAVFWTWLWGPVGLLLATPLTVCLVVAGKYVAQLEFLHVLLGDEPVWDDSSRFYQRLLALDEEEACEVAEEHLEKHSLITLYDDIILPALRLAEIDRHQGNLSPDREAFIKQAISGLLDDLEESTVPLEKPQTGTPADPVRNGRPSGKPGAINGSAPSPPPEPPANPPQVLCLPARDEADEIAARMFTHVLRRAGFPARTLSVENLAGEMLEHVEQSGAAIICVSALPPAAISHSRYLCKRLRARFQNIKVLVGLWHASADMGQARRRLVCSDDDTVVRSLRDALYAIRQFNIPHAQVAGPNAKKP